MLAAGFSCGSTGLHPRVLSPLSRALGDLGPERAAVSKPGDGGAGADSEPGTVSPFPSEGEAGNPLLILLQENYAESTFAPAS